MNFSNKEQFMSTLKVLCNNKLIGLHGVNFNWWNIRKLNFVHVMNIAKKSCFPLFEHEVEKYKQETTSKEKIYYLRHIEVS